MIVMRLIFILLALWSLPGLAQQIAVPELRQQVTDITGTLSTSEQQSLTQQLQDITHKTRAQVAVLVVPSTGDDSIEQYAARVFDSWKLGDKQRNDGILLLVAWEEHAVRIEVGYGLEGVVTDLQAAKIIRDILIPAFKSDDLMGGLTLASENIGALLLNGELSEDRGDYYSINPFIPLSLAVIILLAVLSYFIVFTDPSNLPWITLTGAIYGMVFLYVAEPGPWTNLIVACGMLTPLPSYHCLFFGLSLIKSYALNTRSSVKKELQEKVLLHPLPVAAQVAEAQAVALAAGAVLLAVAARPVAGNSTIKNASPKAVMPIS